MADNITIKDASNNDKIVRTRDRSSVHTQVTELDTLTPYKNLDLDEAGVVVLGSITQLGNVEIFNRGTETIYVKAYSKATAPDENDTPLRVWEVVPGQAFPFQATYPNGLSFPLGLGIRCTTGILDNDTTGPAANACLINLGYRAG